MATGRKIKDETDARRCLMAAERGVLSLGQWARERGIDGRSLRAWQVNLARRGTTRARPQRRVSAAAPARGLVELVPVTTPGRAGTSGARYVLEVAGARLEFGDDCSATTLRRVLEALRSC